MPAMPDPTAIAPHRPRPRRHRAATRLPLRLVLLLVLLATSATAVAAPVRYALDPVHTRVLFAISHAGYSQALGTVSGSQGTLEFDPADWSSARLDVSVPLDRLDLGDADWNRAALARNLLDAARWPQARFVSTAVEPLAADRFILHGALTLHGVTRPLALEVTFNALKRQPLPPFRRTAGFSARATLSRKAFGIDAWPSVIGDHVELRIEAEAVRGGGGAAAGENGAPDDTEASPAPADPGTEPPPAPAPPERQEPSTP